MTQTLAGVTVVDLTQVVSGAVTTMLMAEFGAEVIKVEPPQGEPYRNAGFPISNDQGETNLNILRFSRGKKSITLDLKTEAGRRILSDLIATADVLIENVRPDVLPRLGFGRDEIERLNPGIVYATISGFGHDDLFESPYRDRPAYAIVTEAMAGLTHLAGNGRGMPVWRASRWPTSTPARSRSRESRWRSRSGPRLGSGGASTSRCTTRPSS